MQRHRHDHIGFVQQTRARAVQPAREAGHEIEPVGMLERQDRTAAVFVIAHDGAGAVEGRRIGEAGRAKRVAARIEFEGQSAAGAAGPSRKSMSCQQAAQRLPGSATCVAAADAERREEKIERAAPERSANGFSNRSPSLLV